jgi:Sec-independent protein secretion pathway component TatC
LTPTPDVINQSLLAVPMMLLYVLSIGIAYIWRRPE